MRAVLALILTAFSVSAQDFDFAQLASAPASGAFSPDSVSGLVGWWRADSGVYTDAGTTPANDGEAVYQWNNKVAGGVNLLSITASTRPSYETAEVNGLAAIRFDGTSDYMTNIWASSNAQPNTVIVVCFITNTSAIRIVFDGYTANGRNVGNYTISDFIAVQAGANGINTTNPAPQDVWCFLEFYINSTSSTVRTNGTLMTTSGSMTANSVGSDGLTVGARYSRDQYWFPGMIAEILFYNATLAAGDRTSIETYIRSRYGL